MDLMEMVSRIVGAAKRKPAQGEPQPQQPQPQRQPSTAQLVSGTNRQRWTMYAEAEANEGRDPLPYAEWLKRQQ